MIKKIFYFILAILCFIIGVLGLVLPIIPGIVFLILGVIFLSFASENVKRYLEHLKKKYPRFGHAWQIVEAKLKSWVRR